MIIKWSQRALSDMAHIRDYIAQDSPFYARQFTDRIIKRIENLVDFPHMGRPVPAAERDDIRELIYQGYTALFISSMKFKNTSNSSAFYMAVVIPKA